ncbi:MAG TPA: CPBP family intramembrane glutamic endopeptidase [Meiothermus sp.]|nr:CPBP family intramembrane glutamic endopeptidase [Meiothermus sp.]
MLALITTIVILLIALVLNHIESKLDKKYQVYRNTVIVSLMFFSLWIFIEKEFLFQNWWSITPQQLGITVALTLLICAINIFFYRWAMTGSDYPGLQKLGVISDGCAYNDRLAIPKNFITHGAQVLWEEILFRGIIALSLYYLVGFWPAVIITSLSFGLLHYLPFRSYAIQNSIKLDKYVLNAFISPAFFPAVFIIANLSFSSLMPGWIMHWGLNCSVGLYLKYILPRLAPKEPQPTHVS